jgi:hypothetical protein
MIKTKEQLQKEQISSLLVEMFHYKNKCIELMCDINKLEKKRKYWECKSKRRDYQYGQLCNKYKELKENMKNED